MRGSNNNNGQSNKDSSQISGHDQGNTFLIPSQAQNMHLQQQMFVQFMAQQQIVQQEQLQKQRQLTQQQNGIFAAVRDLQQKTFFENQLQQRPPIGLWQHTLPVQQTHGPCRPNAPFQIPRAPGGNLPLGQRPPRPTMSSSNTIWAGGQTILPSMMGAPNSLPPAQGSRPPSGTPANMSMCAMMTPNANVQTISVVAGANSKPHDMPQYAPPPQHLNPQWASSNFSSLNTPSHPGNFPRKNPVFPNLNPYNPGVSNFNSSLYGGQKTNFPGVRPDVTNLTGQNFSLPGRHRIPNMPGNRFSSPASTAQLQPQNSLGLKVKAQDCCHGNSPSIRNLSRTANSNMSNSDGPDGKRTDEARGTVGRNNDEPKMNYWNTEKSLGEKRNESSKRRDQTERTHDRSRNIDDNFHRNIRSHSRNGEKSRSSERKADRRNKERHHQDWRSQSISSVRESRSSRDASPHSQRRTKSQSYSQDRRERRRKRSRSPSVSLEQDFSTINNQLSQYRQDLLHSEQQEEEDEESEAMSKSKQRTDSKAEMVDMSDHMTEPEPINYFTRSCPADLFFVKNSETGNMEATARMIELENKFEEELVKRAETIISTQNPCEEPPQCSSTHHHDHHHHCSGHKSSTCDSSSSSDDDDDDEGAVSQIMEEWERRKKHPHSLHPELWFNMKGQANDGALCRCSIKSRQSGIRHDIYPGETPLEVCKNEDNNLDRLFHYRLTMSPYTNFLTKVPTLINHDNHEYIFEGFSMYSHVKLENIPPCKLLRFNIEYTIHFIPESAPENFTVRSLNLFSRFIFTEVLELIDMDWTGNRGGCNRFHFMPRFCRTLPDSGCKEVLSMNTVLSFLLKSATALVDEGRLEDIMQSGESEWHAMVDNLRGMIVTNPGKRPSSIRIDQLDRKVTTPLVKLECPNEGSDTGSDKVTVEKTNCSEESQTKDIQPRYPLIIHQGYRPAQLSYAGDPVYRKAWKQYVKFRHLLNSKPKILAADKLKLKEQEEKLREIRMKKTMKREVTIELSSKGFLCTGLRADLFQHALMVPVLMSHLRFHICLDVLEDTLAYKFEDRNLLQLSLTHTSYRTNYGTNPDHTRNSLTNCGMRQVEYGDRRIHYQNTRKRGICILVDIMSRLGKQEETASEIPHNERLEFLGDAVIEFLTSVHLFFMFPWLEEGGLTTYRMALVQNQHLAVLAKKLKLQDFMLYVHGPDLCHESDLQHAMANCCEALMGALFLDGGIDIADRIFSQALFDDDSVLLNTWNDLPKHVLQQQEPGGDRRWVKSSPILQKLEKFEETLGIKFNHIRLLAKAFTHRNIGINPLTMGHNQRLEFLGDTVLQLVASEYLYKHYPEHHEGHLSLLRSSLVNSRTQGMVYDDLGMAEYVIFNENALSDGVDMKTKQRADILESFVGALFVDKDLDYCRTFCDVCFFPRLKDFIMNQDWNDPKSQLQQCCLTLREVGGGEPDIPVYKVIESIGPTNTRKYVVAVYFRGKRLARGTGHSIQQAEMAAATQALKKRAELFPILQHQRRFLERIKKEDKSSDDDDGESPVKKAKRSRQVRRRRPTHSKQKM